MSSTLTAPPPRPRRFANVTRLSKDPEVRSVQIGVAATLLVHLLLFLIAPRLLKTEFSGAMSPKQAASPQQFNIDLSPDLVKPPTPTKFVETNPDAPENEPDKTDNFGAQNQKAAQEKPQADAHNDRPSTEGEKDIHSPQIVDGNLNKEKSQPEPVPPPVTSPPPTEAAPEAKREQNPLSGFEKKEGDTADGIGTNIAKNSPSARSVPDKVDGDPNAPLTDGATSKVVHIDPRKPMPRPAISHNVRPAVFQENKLGTPNMGVTGIDAHWSAYGQYLQKLIEAIQLRWDDLIAASKHYPQQGSTVTVTFVLNSEGKIDAIRKVDATADNLATNWCVSAISPNEGFTYGPWTDDMIAMLGTTQELTFTFMYR
jgi:hypothetical protein